jgi:hypothetical protein
LTQKLYRVRSQRRAGEYRCDTVVNDGSHASRGPEPGAGHGGSKEGERCHAADIECRGDGARRKTDAPCSGESFSFARNGATIPFARHERGILEYSGGVTDDLRLGLDEPRGAANALWIKTAELVNDVVGVEANGLGIVANERTRKDAGRPLGEVVALEACPEVGANLGNGDDGVDTDAAPLTFAAQSGTESVSIRHEY